MTIKQTDTIAALAALFPRALAVPGHLRRPLKVGVFQDLVVRTAGVITLADLHRAINRYTGCTAYLKASQAGAPRIDLDGNVVGEVTPDQAEHARLRLAQLPLFGRQNPFESRG